MENQSRKTFMKKTLIATTALLAVTSQSHAIVIQIDTSTSPSLSLLANWSDSGSGLDESTQTQSIFNTGSPINFFDSYDFESNTVVGEIDGSLTVGGSDTLTLDIEDVSQDNTNGGSGIASLFTTSTWTIELVAENGETNGTPVELDWRMEMNGEITNDATASWELSLGGVEVLSESESVPNIASSVQFNNVDGNTITTYSIGDTLTMEFLMQAVTDGVSSSEFFNTSSLTLTATAIPEPNTIILACGIGVAVIALRRRKQSGQ